MRPHCGWPQATLCAGYNEHKAVGRKGSGVGEVGIGKEKTTILPKIKTHKQNGRKITIPYGCEG